MAVNDNLTDTPELVNSKPYENGWIIKMFPTNRSELETLLSLQDYLRMFCTDSAGK